MTAASVLSPDLHADVLARALDARDPRFDGLFFVGITTTRIYCRPVCPARVSYTSHRRFFTSAAAAERAGFRPCLRCRPELAPGRALVDAVPRLAAAAAERIAAGALNGRGVAELASELGVSERHLRRALEREVGASPLELAQTHRLLLAKQLLADTVLPVARVAYASGFQSLRRFNAAFLARYRMPPSALRRPTARRSSSVAEGGAVPDERVRLTMAYRPPLAWDALLRALERDAIAGVEIVDGGRYSRVVDMGGRRGVASVWSDGDSRARLVVELSASLVPVLMPLLRRLRRVFDLDTDPAAIDAHLAATGLGALVRRRPGVRLAGAFDGFEAVLHELLGARAERVVWELGTAFESGVPGLRTIAPDAGDVATAGAARLATLGVPPRRAEAVVAVARLVARGELRLEPGSSATAVQRLIASQPGVGEATATAIVRRTLKWPDAFAASDRALQRAAGVCTATELLEAAERWRPWRAYAAEHLRLDANHGDAAQRTG